MDKPSLRKIRPGGGHKAKWGWDGGSDGVLGVGYEVWVTCEGACVRECV